MKVIVYLCLVIAALVIVSQGQPCTNDDFYIYNTNGVALRIDSGNDHVHVCNDVDLCNFITSETSRAEESESVVPGVFTETGNSAYKTEAGSVLISGTTLNPTDTSFDGLLSLRTAPQSFIWYASKAALRAGEAAIGGTRDAWNPANIGVQSAAFGVDTIAKGVASFAFGSTTTASGEFSSAAGTGSVASSYASTANGADVQSAQNSVAAANQIKPDNAMHFPGNPDMSLQVPAGPTAFNNGAVSFGLSSRSGGIASTSFGFGSFAAGPASMAFGLQSEASGSGATAFGQRTYASGTEATTWGEQTEATSRRATAWGKQTEAGWPDSTASGYFTSAFAAQTFVAGIGNGVSSHAATVIGSCNTDYIFANQLTTNQVGDITTTKTYPGRARLSTDYIFQIGNGASGSEDPNVCYTQSSALTVLKNGDLYVAGNIYYGVGPNPYDLTPAQKCHCLSADGSCEINSLTQQCTPTTGNSEETGDSAGFPSNNKRSEEAIAQLQSELAELKAQVAKLLSQK